MNDDEYISSINKIINENFGDISNIEKMLTKFFICS